MICHDWSDFQIKKIQQECVQNISSKWNLHHKFNSPWTYKICSHIWFLWKCCFDNVFVKMIFKDFQIFNFVLVYAKYLPWNRWRVKVVTAVTNYSEEPNFLSSQNVVKKKCNVDFLNTVFMNFLYLDPQMFLCSQKWENHF